MASSFRHTIPSDRFSAEKGRYVLYINYICPWAHRTIIIRVLKKLEDIVELVEVDDRDAVHGWSFSGRTGPSKDPIYGVKTLKEIYQKADPHYDGRVTVPLLWDKQHGTAVNNESTDIARMLIDGFDSLLPPEQREANKGVSAFRPSHLVPEIDALNSWMYDTVNNGVYKIGFATSVQSYNEHLGQLFQTLDRLEVHLSQPKHHPYLFGQFITESDIYLFTTLIRFDVAYYSFFKCNLRMIRRDYPCLHAWLRRLYWNTAPETCGGVFRSSTNFDAVGSGSSHGSAIETEITTDCQRIQFRGWKRCHPESSCTTNNAVVNLCCFFPCSNTVFVCGFHTTYQPIQRVVIFTSPLS